MKKFVYLPLITGLMVFYSCTDPFANSTYIDKSELTLEMSCASVLTKNADKFSLWIELLRYANFYNALNDATTTATVFAPTNEAMQKFLDWQGVKTVQELDLDYAKAVAKVHIINDDLSDEMLVNYAEKSMTIPKATVFGSYLSVAFGYTITDVDDADLTSMVYVSDSIYLNNQARLAEFTALKTANGELFTMADVIHPLSETILEKLRPYGEYHLFIEAAERCGYNHVASQIADTTYNLDGTFSINTPTFTCLAVPDEVYHRYQLTTVNELMEYLSKEHRGENADTLLYNYMAYHFLPRSYTTEQLFSFEEKGQVSIFDTQLPYQVITTEQDTLSGDYLINQQTRVLRSNMEARNGIIHKIDALLPVYSPRPITVIWDFCNSPDIISMANSYGGKKSLGELFSSPLSGKEYFIDLTEDKRDGDIGTATSFTYMANSSKSSYSTWRKVGFMKCSYISNKEPKVNKYKAYMDNLLTLNLGYAGWIQFETPTIIKGKYKIELHYASSVALRSYYSSGSLTKINLDDYQTTFYMWKGLPNDFGSGVASSTLWTEMEFEISGSHTLKATMMDINAKTSSSYRQMWDYIKFIPLD